MDQKGRNFFVSSGSGTASVCGSVRSSAPQLVAGNNDITFKRLLSFSPRHLHTRCACVTVIIVNNFHSIVSRTRRTGRGTTTEKLNKTIRRQHRTAAATRRNNTNVCVYTHWHARANVANVCALFINSGGGGDDLTSSEPPNGGVSRLLFLLSRPVSLFPSPAVAAAANALVASVRSARRRRRSVLRVARPVGAFRFVAVFIEHTTCRRSPNSTTVDRECRAQPASSTAPFSRVRVPVSAPQFAYRRGCAPKCG